MYGGSKKDFEHNSTQKSTSRVQKGQKRPKQCGIKKKKIKGFTSKTKDNSLFEQARKFLLNLIKISKIVQWGPEEAKKTPNGAEVILKR